MPNQNLDSKVLQNAAAASRKTNQDQDQTEGRFSVRKELPCAAPSFLPDSTCDPGLLCKAQNLLPASGKKQENWRPLYGNFYISKFA